MAVYEVDGARSRVITRARSRLHDTTTRWGRVRGTVQARADALEESSGSFAVDMTDLDAGDFLRNRKLRRDLAVAAHPEARFELVAVEEVERRGGAGFAARARGRLTWRGRAVDVVIAGSGRIDERAIEAAARFELDVTALGVTPPRFLVFKVDDVVEVEVALAARAVVDDR